MISDNEIKKNVEAELRWDPDVSTTDVAITVRGGVVSLTGYVSTFAQKFQAELDVKRVTGVTGVANDIEVRLPNSERRSDPEIARDAVTAIQLQLPNAYGNIKVIVRDGWMTLEGETEWHYLRERADNAVHHLKGVKGVINSIIVKPVASPIEVKRKIEEALKRSAEIDAQAITVEAHDGEVILKGTVHSWFERKEAERAAWSAPGVTRVQDKISVQP